MKYIQKNADNVIIAMASTQPEVKEDANGAWFEVADEDVITAVNGKMYYKQADTAELEEFHKDRRITEIHQEIAALEASQARPLRELELMALGVQDETEKDFALNKLKQIQADIESLRAELVALSVIPEPAQAVPEMLASETEMAAAEAVMTELLKAEDIAELKSEVDALLQKLQRLCAI